MKQYIAIIVIITLVPNSQCGLVDGIFGAVKDTTNAIRQDIRGVVHYGKTAVFGEDQPAPVQTYAVTERIGLIDKISHKIHDVATGVREHVRGVIAIFHRDENGNGLIGRIFNRLKNRIMAFKGWISSLDEMKKEALNNTKEHKDSDNLIKLKEKLKQYVFSNSSSRPLGIKKTLQSLQEAVDQLRKNMTKHKKDDDTNKNTDGTGLLDIRSDFSELDRNLQDHKHNFDNRIDAAYNNAENQAIRMRDNAKNAINDMKQNSDNFIEEQRNNLRNNYNSLRDNANDFRNNVGDSLNKFGDVLRSDIEDTNKYLRNGYSAVEEKD